MSIRRDQALEPYKTSSSWTHFQDLNDLRKNYDGGWLTGSVGVLGDAVDFSIKRQRDSKRLAVIFNSQQKADSPLKLFTWGNVGKLLDCTRLHIADPTLNISEVATLGWYTANKKGNFQYQIGQLILLFKEALDVEEIVFLGSSGGGFPAAYYSQLFPGSLALLLAPVFNVSRSIQSKAKQQFAVDLNGVDTFDDALQCHPDVSFDVGAMVRENDGRLLSSIHILQSRGDSGFWQHQTQPFLEQIGTRCQLPPKSLSQDGFSMLLGEWSDGHAPPPIDVINAACRSLASLPLGTLDQYDLSKL